MRALLPGEDAAAFEKLHRELIAEVAPIGAFEDETVLTLARLMWRRQNLGAFRVAKLAQDRYATIERQKLIPLGGGTFGVNRQAAIKAAHAQARKELGDYYELVELGKSATLEQLMKELDVEDRLDAMIDRCVKRLLHWRTLKSLPSSAQSASLPGAQKLLNSA
jgi:hypothetical protein